VVATLFVTAVAACHARLIAHARRSGVRRGAHDLIIAAHAAQTDRVVLAFDARAASLIFAVSPPPSRKHNRGSPLATGHVGHRGW
jgi:predicted nucleic acid-binding protein